MGQQKWFDKKFDFSFDENLFPSIIERLKNTPQLIREKITSIPAEQLTTKKSGTWSIQENIGHLIDLEPIWQGRLQDILNNTKELRAADLKNKKTDLANHNNKNINTLIEEFLNIRQLTITKLLQLTEKEVYQYALHPRLKTPMRTMDLFLFVAEHDDYHLERINELMLK